MTDWKKGELAYFVRDLDPSGLTDNPMVDSIVIVQASNKQITLAKIGPDGMLRFGLVGDNPKLHANGRVKLFHSPAEALLEYHEHCHRDIGNKRRALATAELRAEWASDQLQAQLDELHEKRNRAELDARAQRDPGPGKRAP